MTRWQRWLDWNPQTRSIWLRLGVAVVITLLAAWLRIVLAPAESGGRFITLSLAVALSALFGGFAAGMLSTVLGMLLVNFFLVKPYLSLAFANPLEALWLNLWYLITQLVVVGAIARMQERNERIRETNELTQREQQRFFDSFEYAAAGITHVARDGHLLRVNPTFCRLVGYDADALMQMRFQDLTHPDDVGPDELFIRQMLDGTRSSYSLEKRYIHKDGHIVWAHLTVSLMRDAHGLPDYFISVVQDISGVKAAEHTIRTNERLMRQAQAIAGFAIWEADIAAGRFNMLGDSHRYLRQAPHSLNAEELLQMTHHKDRERIHAEWIDAIRGGGNYNSTYRVRMNGEYRWLSMRAEFERDADGRAIRAFGVAQDITERKRIEHEIRRLNVSLEQRIQERTRDLKAAYDELESYSYAVAHDLRSPLRIINGFAQALEDDSSTLGPDSRVHLSRIKAASAKMGMLIDGLLQLSQIGRGDVQRVQVHLSAIATRLLEELATESPQRDVSWTVEPGLFANADPALVEALLQNLLHNAWKYTASTPAAQIQVFGRTVDGQEHFCVRDNGAGFDMKRAEKLFQPFQRLHQPHEFSGLGIGLATAQRIVQRHGGTLRAEAAPGQGATFCFTLPVSDAPESLP